MNKPHLREIKKDSNFPYSKELLLKFFRSMLLIRRFEEKTGQLYGMGMIGGFCHLYIGQEAVVTGMQECIITAKDQVITTYRDHAHMLACGTDPKVILAELLGRETGCSRGKGGSMHMFDLKNQFYGGHGIVGASVPIGAGLAFANKYRGNDSLCLCYFGDGAANQGQVFEAMNMAAMWKLPVVFIIENNRYAMGTSTNRSTANDDYYKRGEIFGIPGVQVDGQDVLAVYEAGKKVVEHLRAGKGPYVMEMETYRYRGHSMSDPAKYRTKEEVEKYKDEKDPIENIKKIIFQKNFASEEELKKIEDEIKLIVSDAVEFAKSSAEPDANELFTDITR
jgi:pyruvate dehydrogenase E1 component alpha subunit